MKPIHLSRIDLNLFVVFDAIYTEGGITRASKRLSLTQPAISHALGRLRELFDDALFVRQGKLMIPTPLAPVMIDPVRQSLQGPEATAGKYFRRELCSLLPFITQAFVVAPLNFRGWILRFVDSGRHRHHLGAMSLGVLPQREPIHTRYEHCLH
jgi:DNA-binding transcriptional LysR family regulator